MQGGKINMAMNSDSEDIVYLSSDDDLDVASPKGRGSASFAELSQSRTTPKKKSSGKMPLLNLSIDDCAFSGSTSKPDCRVPLFFSNTSQRKKYGSNDSKKLQVCQDAFSVRVQTNSGGSHSKNSCGVIKRPLAGPKVKATTSNRCETSKKNRERSSSPVIGTTSNWCKQSPSYVDSSSPIFARADVAKQSAAKVNVCDTFVATAVIAESEPKCSQPCRNSSKINNNIYGKEQLVINGVGSKQSNQSMKNVGRLDSPDNCSQLNNVRKSSVVRSSELGQSSGKISANQNRLRLRKKRAVCSEQYSDVEPSSDDEQFVSRRKLLFTRKNLGTDYAASPPLARNKTDSILPKKTEVYTSTSNVNCLDESSSNQQSEPSIQNGVEWKGPNVIKNDHLNFAGREQPLESCSVLRLCESPRFDHKSSTDSLLVDCCISLEKLHASDLPGSLSLSQNDLMTLFGQNAGECITSTDTESFGDSGTRNASTSTSCTSQVLITPMSCKASRSYIDFISDDDLFEVDYFVTKNPATSEAVSVAGLPSICATAVPCATARETPSIVGLPISSTTAVSCSTESETIGSMGPHSAHVTIVSSSAIKETACVVGSPPRSVTSEVCSATTEEINATMVFDKLVEKCSVSSASLSSVIDVKAVAVDVSEQMCVAYQSVCDGKVVKGSSSDCSGIDLMCTTIKTEPRLAIGETLDKISKNLAYSQADEDCFITSDSDDELFANLTQKVEADMLSKCSDDDDAEVICLGEESSDTMDDDVEVPSAEVILENLEGLNKTCGSLKPCDSFNALDSRKENGANTSYTPVCEQPGIDDLWENDDEYMKDLNELYQKIVDPMEVILVDLDGTRGTVDRESAQSSDSSHKEVKQQAVDNAIVKPSTNQANCGLLSSSSNNQAVKDSNTPNSDSEESDEFLLNAVELIDPSPMEKTAPVESTNESASGCSNSQSIAKPQKTLRLQVSRIPDSVFRELSRKPQGIVTARNRINATTLVTSESGTEDESESKEAINENVMNAAKQNCANDTKKHIASRADETSSNEIKSAVFKNPGTLRMPEDKLNAISAEEVQQLVNGLQTKGRQLASSILIPLPERNIAKKRTCVTMEEEVVEQQQFDRKNHDGPEKKVRKTLLLEDVSSVHMVPSLSLRKPCSKNVPDRVEKKITQLLTRDPRKLRIDGRVKVPTRHRNPLTSDNSFEMSQVSRAKHQLMERTLKLTDTATAAKRNRESLVKNQPLTEDNGVTGMTNILDPAMLQKQSNQSMPSDVQKLPGGNRENHLNKETSERTRGEVTDLCAGDLGAELRQISRSGHDLFTAGSDVSGLVEPSKECIKAHRDHGLSNPAEEKKAKDDSSKSKSVKKNKVTFREPVEKNQATFNKTSVGTTKKTAVVAACNETLVKRSAQKIISRDKLSEGTDKSSNDVIAISTYLKSSNTSMPDRGIDSGKCGEAQVSSSNETARPFLRCDEVATVLSSKESISLKSSATVQSVCTIDSLVQSALQQRQVLSTPGALADKPFHKPSVPKMAKMRFEDIIMPNAELPVAKTDAVPALLPGYLLFEILAWNPKWLDEYAKHAAESKHREPPPIIKSINKVYPLLESYNSFEDYLNIIYPLLVHDIWESVFNEWKAGPGRQKISKICAFSLDIDKSTDIGSMNLTCHSALEPQDTELREGDLVIIHLRQPTTPVDVNKTSSKNQLPMPEVKPVFGYVVNSQKYGNRGSEKVHDLVAKKLAGDKRRYAMKYVIQLNYRKYPIDNANFLDLQRVSSLLTSMRQFQALVSLPRSMLARDILRPCSKHVFFHNDTVADSSRQINVLLNASQYEAISRISHAVSQPYASPKICLLQGPPGTGKSFTIIRLIENILRQKTRECNKIMLCAPSNAGIDELCRRLRDRNNVASKSNLKQIEFVRVGQVSSMHADIKPFSLPELAKVQFHKKQEPLLKSVNQAVNDLNKKIALYSKQRETFVKQKNLIETNRVDGELAKLNKRKLACNPQSMNFTASEEMKMKKLVMLNADVVCTTLNHSGSSLLWDVLKPAIEDGKRIIRFGSVIVDEACQCTELDCLIPLQYGVTKLVLVGDPEQLPPTVISQRASEMNYGQSLFERLYGCFKLMPVSPVIMLKTQYRMHADICQFPNNYIYGGQLETDRAIAEKRKCFPFQSYTVFDLKDSYEELDSSSNSVCNPNEAVAVKMLCLQISTYLKPMNRLSSVGIITPYQRQRKLIVDQLASCHLNEIEVGTVDGFQGREKDVIIVSCVRANRTSSIGFLGDRRRLNVSLTRARYSLYVVGNMATLQTANKDWSALYDDACQRNRVVQISSMTYADRLIHEGCSKPR